MKLRIDYYHKMKYIETMGDLEAVKHHLMIKWEVNMVETADTNLYKLKIMVKSHKRRVAYH